MPKREDEYWAGTKEPRGRGLCPFCGSSNIYYNEYFKSWRCARCEKSFPSPSYGQGKGFGKEARWFGRTTAGERSSGEALIKDRRWKRASTYRILPSWLAVLLVIAVLGAIIGAAGYELGWFSKIPAPSNFDIVSEDRQITLSWTLNEDSDGVLIRFSTSNYPASSEDGTELYWGTGTSYVHSGLINGAAYYYTIWSVRDAEGTLLYSQSRHASGTPVWIGPDGESEVEDVFYQGGYVIGGDGHRIELINNPDAEDPTWDELRAFLAGDETDEQAYIPSSFVCADFAEVLHNNAEEEGLRAAYVLVDLQDHPEGHALNAFDTTDRGLVYIDDTGTVEYCPCSADKIVTVQVGEEYIPESIFPCQGWSSTWESLGMVADICIQW